MPNREIHVTAGEMQFLTMLWDAGPLTLGQSHEQIASYGREIAYPTVQTHLNRMVEKGLVRRSDQRPAVYSAAVTRDRVTRGRLQELLASLTGGQVIPLVAKLVDQHELSDEQIDELEQLLQQAKGKAKASKKKRGKQ